MHTDGDEQPVQPYIVHDVWHFLSSVDKYPGEQVSHSFRFEHLSQLSI